MLNIIVNIVYINKSLLMRYCNRVAEQKRTFCLSVATATYAHTKFVASIVINGGTAETGLNREWSISGISVENATKLLYTRLYAAHKHRRKLQ